MEQNEDSNPKETPEDAIDKRQRRLTRKALINAVEEKRRVMIAAKNKLFKVIRVAEGENLDGADTGNIQRDIASASEELKVLMQELYTLYEQDKYDDFGDEALLNEESLLLRRAYVTIEQIKRNESDKLLETSSHRSRHSRHSGLAPSCVSSTASTARLRALAEAAAARQSAEFDKLLAEREHERKTRELEIEKAKQEEKARCEKDIAILAAQRNVAIADAKLKAIDDAISEECVGENPELQGLPKAQPQQRTIQWVHKNSISKTEPNVTDTQLKQSFDMPKDLIDPDKDKLQLQTSRKENDKRGPYHAITDHPLAQSTPIRDISGSQFIDSLASVNKQIVSELAKQSLPKCHPDVFGGDATLFHPWKTAFQAMIEDASVTPTQEINYLRSFTSGEVQKLVDNYRKRHQRNPAALLESLWEELERRFGSEAVITNTLLKRLQQTAAFQENENLKLQQFADLCADVESQVTQLPGLACLNYPIAIQPIAEKLPSSLRSKWEKEVAKHSDKNRGAYPGFQSFARMIREQAKLKNNPNIVTGSCLAAIATGTIVTQRRTTRRALKTTTNSDPSNEVREKKKHCPFHERDGHTLEDCKAFAAKSIEEKTEWILKAGLCFRCLEGDHTASRCKREVECSICGERRHIALLHKERNNKVKTAEAETSNPNPKCTAVCDASEGGTSCSKILPLDVYHRERPELCHRVYAIIDDQSNSSLISSELADELGANGPQKKYFLSTCGREEEVRYGRRVAGVTIKSVNGAIQELPVLVECDSIPQDKHEIPTPETARRFPHLNEIASEIPQLDNEADIHLLIGRDAPELLKVREFKNGPRGAPWAQRLDLGWTITGQVCHDLIDGPAHVVAHRTSLHDDVRISKQHGNEIAGVFGLKRCPNALRIKEAVTPRNIENDVFLTTKDDNDTSLSVDDRRFLNIMNQEIHKNENGNWEMPLPFRKRSINLPNNRAQALHRLTSLLRTLRKKPQMEKDYLEFMAKVFERGHASAVPAAELRADRGSVWYLPHFGVYHPKKPKQIRVVFDSSAEFEGVSLNKELLAGPDLMNSLVGVLMRFRKENVGVMCDIEQMFHSFSVNPEDRNFLRFLWFKENDPSMPITEYRMAVHLFGNGPSPAVATFGLRRTVENGEESTPAVKNFVRRNFYVDDGLTSQPTAEETIKLVRDTQTVLATANLRLHKVVSNSVTVMKAFPTDDLAKDVQSLDLRFDELPAQRSLGVSWDLEKDAFTYKVSLPDKPFTRRGVLSLINSIYDPLGIAAPVLLEGRILLQQLVALGKEKESPTLGWDDPLPAELANRWEHWRNTLTDLQQVSVPRCYHSKEFGRITKAEIHTFSDASQHAIGVAVYLRLFNQRNEVEVSLVFGQAKLAPLSPTSIPRLELCAAVLAAQATDKVTKELDMEISKVVFYSDSKVVLGYIRNESRRFHVYVANRVQTIHKFSAPDQWRYVETSKNPADIATRGLKAKDLKKSDWLSGPDFLRDGTDIPLTSEMKQMGISAEDPEVRKEVTVKSTSIQRLQGLGSHRFTRFSSLSSLQRAIAILIVQIKEFKRRRNEPHTRKRNSALKVKLRDPTVKELQQAMTVIVRAVQKDTFQPELDMNRATVTEAKEKRDRKESKIYRLDPFLDASGVLRVGGRLRRAELEYGEKHPVILPKAHHVSRLVVRHYHTRVHHQGRQITSGALRQAGYWLIGSHNTVAKELNQCVICKKLRGPPLTQRMADLPADRTQVQPPFTNVGFDVFGPWTIHTRRTRGGAANSKRWALLLTCLSSRAIHIEVLESMDADSFICALRRFLALRGPATLFRCDRGTNFVGGKSELDSALMEMNKEKIEKYLKEQGCEWSFNPPRASNFGGAWERQIGTIRRVLDAMFAELGSTQLTHELLVTLMAEVSAIVNARPIAALPTDTDDPQPLSPAMLLTMKTRPLCSPPGVFIPVDLYARRRWRRVQYLADQFWTRWRKEYLQTLQPRQKWNETRRNLTVGDIVLMKEQDTNRNDWPMGVITEAVKSEDGLVRKAHVEIVKEGERKKFLRPVKEFVLLIPATHPDGIQGQKTMDSR